MEYIVTAFFTVLFTLLFLGIYKFGFKPQVVLTFDGSKMARCPDQWSYDSIQGVCKPTYTTHCLPFDPSAPALATGSSKCNLARTCGTTWSGMCG
jgi:hypothetical protein